MTRRIALALAVLALTGCGPKPTMIGIPQESPSPSAAPWWPVAVHPGAYCAPHGAHGNTADGMPMVCTDSPTDPRNRWRNP